MRAGVSKTKAKKIFGKIGAAGQKPSAAGRPARIGSRAAEQLHKLIRKTQEQEGKAQEVTAAKIWAAWKARKKPSLKTLRRWLQKNYSWKAPSLRAQLKPGDREDRAAYADRYGWKPKEFWRGVVFIDGHSVKKVSSLRVRSHAARNMCRAQYRRVANGKVRKVSKLPPCHTRGRDRRPSGKGASLKYIIGICWEGGIFFIYRIDNAPGWNSKRAIDMYARLHKSAAHHFGSPITVYEDNDPIWKEKSAMAAKKQIGIRAMAGGVPKRSPDLNPLDSHVNAELDRRILRSYQRGSRKRVSQLDFERRVVKIAFSKSMTLYVRKVIDGIPERLRKMDPCCVS